MGIPIGNTYTATASGSVWRPVRCEHCDVSFAYLMKREGIGVADSLLWSRNEAAGEEASAMAQESLAVQLESQWDARPCPGCGAYQSSMTYLWRKARFMNVAFVLGGVLALCSATLFVMILFDFHPPRAAASGLRWASLTSFFGMGVAWYWSQRLDPNADAAKRAGRVEPGVLRKEAYEERVAEGALPPLSWERAHLPPA